MLGLNSVREGIDAKASYRFKMATLNKSEYVLDELVCFLSNPLFQIPVLSFMETKCLIFNPSIEDTPSYHDIQEEYSKLVDLLLEGFRTDTGLSHEQIIEAMKTIISKPELRDVFQVLYDQVAATLDYQLFVRIMTQKNMDLQQQALLLISQMLGGNLPESLMKDSAASIGVSWGSGQPNSSDEDQILLAALATSKEEYEREREQTEEEQDELKLIIELSQATNIMLHHPVKKEEEQLHDSFQKSLSLKDGSGESPKPSVPKPTSVPPPAVYTSKKQSAPITDTKPKPAASSVTDTKPTASPISSADAAAAWMKSAETEVNSSDAHLKAVQAAAASIAGVSEEEFKKRSEFLRQQRDKLMEMKRKERVKKLLSAEQSQPQRPASARAARAALRQAQEPTKPTAEEEAKLALRNTIARNLKAELLNKK
ncbi:cilia- and flagella-associated protein 36-like [Physella acuta]|uniref:cilia- and flagella-associated protein 36-like n=1 Tax=Physella acuta TaxID=109671 RepID=UPI0027DD21B1|nr:cilia- and flagella-associated protein 36-like [Physella acuta]